jgi:hypothetical protein
MVQRGCDRTCATSLKLAHTKLRSDVAIRALSPSPLPNWERGAGRRGEGSTIFDCNLVSVTKAPNNCHQRV